MAVAPIKVAQDRIPVEASKSQPNALHWGPLPLRPTFNSFALGGRYLILIEKHNGTGFDQSLRPKSQPSGSCPKGVFGVVPELPEGDSDDGLIGLTGAVQMVLTFVQLQYRRETRA